MVGMAVVTDVAHFMLQLVAIAMVHLVRLTVVTDVAHMFGLAVLPDVAHFMLPLAAVDVVHLVVDTSWICCHHPFSSPVCNIYRC